jgi:hypothetical protein
LYSFWSLIVVLALKPQRRASASFSILAILLREPHAGVGEAVLHPGLS